MTIWNNLNPVFREIRTFSLFKSKVRLRPIYLKTSTIHLKNLNRKEELCLNRLRADLLLKSHLYAHNFTTVNNPNCNHCGVHCTTAHFMLNCRDPNHRIKINRLQGDLHDLGVLDKFNSLNRIDKLNMLLYGHDELSSDQNNAILRLVSKFIQENHHSL